MVSPTATVWVRPESTMPPGSRLGVWTGAGAAPSL